MAVTLSHHASHSEITVNKIRIGGKTPTAIYKGGVEVKKVTKGSTVVYQKENVSYGIELELQEVNDATTYLSSCSFSTNNISGDFMEATLNLYYNASNFDLKIGAYKGNSIQYGTNFITVDKSGSFTGTISSGAPYFYYRYAYQPNVTADVLNRGTISISNNINSIFKPLILLNISQNANTTVYSKITLTFCNLLSSTSIYQLAFNVKYTDGTTLGTSQGGGIKGQTSWTDTRTMKISREGATNYVAVFDKLVTIVQKTGTGSNETVYTGGWQLRIHTSAPTYANRKTTGTQIYKGYGSVEGSSPKSPVSTVQVTGNVHRYIWICEQ